MGYSLKKSDLSKTKQGTEFTYFSEEEWNCYPFVNEQEIRSFSARWYLGNRNG